jgi:ubiquinone biosynthesis O-methyltransferase
MLFERDTCRLCMSRFDCSSGQVVEHVADPELFVRSLSALTRPGGAVVVSTINRTLRSFALGIVAAERILGWVPPGTHEWRRFLKPAELAVMLEQEGLELEEMAGLEYLPVKGRWQLSSDTGVGYIALATKPLGDERTTT